MSNKLKVERLGDKGATISDNDTIIELSNPDEIRTVILGLEVSLEGILRDFRKKR